MRVLVTGASGFIGRYSIKFLQSMGHDVVGVCRYLSSDLHNIKIDWQVADLLSEGSASVLMDKVRPDALLHLAWCTENGKFWNDPANLTWLARSCDLVEAAKTVGVRRIVIAGTCFEFKFSDGDCDEHTTPVENHFLYDTAKDAFRRVAEAWCQPNNISFGWARLFHLYGPGEDPARLVCSIARSLIRGEPARCSTGQVLRDYMHVSDAGAALAAFVVSEVRGVVNIASGEPVRIADIARYLGEISGRPDLVCLGALPDRQNDPSRITANVARLRQEIGFIPNYELRAGLDHFYRFLVTHE